MKLIVLILLFFSSNGYSEIYQWVDNNNKIHFSDKKPAHIKAKEINPQTNTYSSATYSKSILNSRVIMYSTSWCGYCKKAKTYFKKNKIAFTEYDIEKNRSARARYKKLGATNIPLILVGNKRMTGFSISRFERLYQ